MQAACVGGEGAACAIHAWSRVVLPSITHQEVTLAAKATKKTGGKAATKQSKPPSVYHIEPDARDSAVAFLREVLLANSASVHRSALRVASRVGLPVGPGGAREPVVPASAVAGLRAAISGAVTTARGTAEAIEPVLLDLTELCDDCRNPEVVAAAVSRAMTAADAAAHAEDDVALFAATQALIGQLARHGDAAGNAWAKDHRNKLAGSTAMLELLAADSSLVEPLVNADRGSDSLLNALDGLAKAHASILASGKETPAKELAKRAERAARSLSQSSFNVLPGSARWSIASLIVLAVAVVAMSVHSPKRVEGVLEPVVGASNAALFTSSCQEAVSGVRGLFETMWDHWTGSSG
jgi:hypothetical protein